jgi:hypothetical protein
MSIVRDRGGDARDEAARPRRSRADGEDMGSLRDMKRRAMLATLGGTRPYSRALGAGRLYPA